MQVSIFGWAGALVSAWRAGFGWPQLSLVAALAAASIKFSGAFYPRALPSFLAYLIMQHSSSHPEPLHEPSTLARMAGLDLNAPLEEEADAWLDLNIPVVQPEEEADAFVDIGKFAYLLHCFLAFRLSMFVLFYK